MSVIESPARPDLGEVLRAVNEIRAAHGDDPIDELPKGKPTCITNCALARAFGHAAVGAWDYAYLDDDDHHMGPDVRLPSLLIAFRRAFDSGEYPELIA